MHFILMSGIKNLIALFIELPKIENKKILKGKELLISDMYGLLFSLRGFPWEEQNSAEIVFLNGSSN